MISSIYKNGIIYYNIIKELLDNKITHIELKKRHLDQRKRDLYENKPSGFNKDYLKKVANLNDNYKIFKEENRDELYISTWEGNCLDILARYESAAEHLDIRGEWFFMGIWSFIESYISEYMPSDDTSFNPNINHDEARLSTVLQAAYDVLTRQKHRWLLKKDGGSIDEDRDPSTHNMSIEE